MIHEENLDFQTSCCLSRKNRSRKKIYKDFKTRNERCNIHGMEGEGNAVDKRNLFARQHPLLYLFIYKLRIHSTKQHGIGLDWFKEKNKKVKPLYHLMHNYTSLPISFLDLSLTILYHYKSPREMEGYSVVFPKYPKQSSTHLFFIYFFFLLNTQFFFIDNFIIIFIINMCIIYMYFD